MVVLLPGMADDGLSGFESLFDHVNEVLEEMIAGGLITSEEHDHLRPAAIKAGVPIAKGQRFGLHNFRHSLSTFLITSKIQAKTVQGLLRHANVKTTLNLYTQADGDETRAAQGRFLSAVGLTERIQ